MRSIVVPSSLRAVVALGIFLLLLGVPDVRADRLRPVRGVVNFSVFLCKFQGQPAPPQDPEYYEDLFFGSRMDSLGDYLYNMSSKSVRTDGVVKGWYEMNVTLEEGWHQAYENCVATVLEANEYRAPDDHVKVVVAYPTVYPTATFGSNGRVVLDWDAPLGQFQQLVMSSMGLSPSFAFNSSFCYFNRAEVGAYGDLWDTMSFMHTHDWDTFQFNKSGPGLNAFHRDRMGWIPIDRIVRFGSDGVYNKIVNLTSLSDPKGPTSGSMMVRIPINATDRQHYLTVEYRTPKVWDRSIGGNSVLIHEVSSRDATRCDTGASTGRKQRSYVLVTDNGIGNLESVKMNGVTISVVSKSSTRARIRIKTTNRIVPSYGPNTCKSGYVWREGDKLDYVCTTPARRTAVQTENRLASSRRNPAGGPFGPDTCKQGFVWREAWPEDHVCVTPASRRTAAIENAAAYGRLAFPK